MTVRRQIEVAGIVQGVGFRPYVYRLALEGSLAGNISNTPTGVTIEVEGPVEAVEEFVARLPASAPPLARITSVQVRELSCVGEQQFRIVATRRGERARTLISADVAVCDACLHELFDPSNRRYGYPFINCTNCGPRFTIVRDIPYDRPHTSMAVFEMCSRCRAEYEDPLDRRFHAQPNACWECGPQVELWDRNGRKLLAQNPIAEAAAALEAGLVVAVKGLGGFHLAADATSPAAVARLRERKRRVEKPFAIMLPSLEVAERLCAVDEQARQTLALPQRPIVLLPRKQPSPVSEQVAPNLYELGVFLPYTPLHHLLFAKGGFQALVMTSGNLSEEPIAIDNGEAVNRLSQLVDLFLVHNREILLRCDDSVVRVFEGKPRQLRRSRGFVPVPVFLKEAVPAVLAVGGELKNTICLTRENHAFLSQHVGDLENLESYRFFKEAVDHLGRVLEIKPQAIGYDLHPDYFSTKWALDQELPKFGVQHHHAHIASCMAENGLDAKVIGFALDGTGYGTDDCIWGGEVLVAGYEDFERAAHLEYVPLPGGAAAIREPWRMAVSYLTHHFGRDFLKLKVPFVQQVNAARAELVIRMVERGVHAPLTSSCGRLFDAVAALIGIRHRVNYEAQAAIELEAAIDGKQDDGKYRFEVKQQGSSWIIGSRPLFEAMLEDLRRNVSAGVISRRFHDGLAEVLVQAAELIRGQTFLDRVCLSGGTFNNAYLLRRLKNSLEAAGFQVFTHSQVPAGDGGLSLGQSLIAAHRFSRP
jgi:hydrogenase maturation protein HypF